LTAEFKNGEFLARVFTKQETNDETTLTLKATITDLRLNQFDRYDAIYVTNLNL
jgi:hypothetical protein